MRVARMGYAQQVIKRNKDGRVTQSFLRVRVVVHDPIVRYLLPEPYRGLGTLTKKVTTEREHAEWTAQFLSMIEDAKAVFDPTKKKPVEHVRVPLAPLATEKRIMITSVQRGGFGSHFVPEDKAAAILAEQAVERRESEAALPELPPDWPYLSQGQPEPVSSPPASKSSAWVKSADPVRFEPVVRLWARERKILSPGDRQMLSKANRLAIEPQARGYARHVNFPPKSERRGGPGGSPYPTTAGNRPRACGRRERQKARTQIGTEQNATALPSRTLPKSAARLSPPKEREFLRT